MISQSTNALCRVKRAGGMKEEREAWEILKIQRLLIAVAIQEAEPGKTNALVRELERVSRFMEAHYPIDWRAFAASEQNSIRL